MPAPATDLQLDVFNRLVESDDDFLGLLAYSLYKRHKIEWIRNHASDHPDAFKKVACTPQQISMYREHTEQLAKNFIDVSHEELGQEMKDAMTRSVIMEKIESLKPGFWRSLGIHTLSGFASVTVALALFGLLHFIRTIRKMAALRDASSR